jgi:hypothetical protein
LSPKPQEIKLPFFKPMLFIASIEGALFFDLQAPVNNRRSVSKVELEKKIDELLSIVKAFTVNPPCGLRRCSQLNKGRNKIWSKMILNKIRLVRFLYKVI